MMQLFFFAQRGIFERAFARRQGAAMRAMDQSMGVKDFEILANRNLRGFELAGKFCDQDPSLMVVSKSRMARRRSSLSTGLALGEFVGRKSGPDSAAFLFIAFSFRLSTAKRQVEFRHFAAVRAKSVSETQRPAGVDLINPDFTGSWNHWDDNQLNTCHQTPIAPEGADLP